MKNPEEDASSKPRGGGGGTTSVTREAEGRALAFLPYKMALPPAATEPREKGSSNGTRVVHKLSRDQSGYQIQSGGRDVWGGNRWMATKVTEQEFQTYLI